MGLRCLIGHDFGEVQTDRDRRERGNEVVVTIREFRECDRCGETRVVSENKEVRSATPPSATPADRDVDADESTSDEAIPDDRLDDVEADEDDGVILEDEPVERARGEWPAAEDDEPSDGDDAAEPTPWPEVEGEDEGFAAEPNDGGSLEGVEFGSAGLTPEAATSDANGAAAVEAGGDVVEPSQSGRRGRISRAEPSPPPTDRQRPVHAETEFFCPQCEFATPTEDSSLRPGDICPTCRLGYLTERDL